MINLGVFRAPAWQVACLVAVVAALAAVPLWGGAYVWSLMCLTIMWIGLALSWNLVSGYTGYVSLGHTAFFGMGAYVGSLVYMALGVGWGLAAIVAGVVTAAVAAPIGYVLLRLRGPFFAIGMLGLSEVFRLGANKLSGWTGGGAGLYLETGDRIWLIYFGFLITALAAFVVTWVVAERPYGRVLLAIRDDEEAAEVLGKRTTANKVTAFVVSAFFPGVLGTVYAIFLSYIDPESAFTIEYNLIIVLMAVLGGAGTVLGPVIGAAVIGAMRETFWVSFPQLHLIVFGLAVVALVMVWPDGVYPPLLRLATRMGRRTRKTAAAGGDADIDLARLADLAEIGTGARADETQQLLRVESLEKSFAGRRVINGCTFRVDSGSITGLIGPNGSGKTTVLNLVNGLLTPDAGHILLAGGRVDGRSPHAIAGAGVGRTFQVPRLFDRLSVLDNMLVASSPELDADQVANRTESRSTSTAFRPLLSGRLSNDQLRRERVTASLQLVGLLGLEDRPAGSLSYGQRKLLEIARVLVTGPRLILMDEPFAGVNPVLREKIAELVRALRDRGLTFVVIGHEMTEMMALCERMIVLDQGAVLADGTPMTIQEDERVFEAYFGRGRGFVPEGRQ